MTTRQDAWTKEEDILLAEIVLQFIKDGGTQLQAFEEVGKQLSRTSSACGFRWNSYVRKQYQPAIESAKACRKLLKKGILIEEKVVAVVNEQKEKSHWKSDNFEQILEYIRDVYFKSKKYEVQKGLLVKYKDLQEENNRLKNELVSVDESYQAIVVLMEKAREMVLSK